MGPELLEIQPRELKFTFELKKQSLCSVQLINNSNHYVAFKVKTTSPKRYCVRPNTGIVQPNSTCDFSVTMQAQRVAPLDMQCKDKFLIQSTIVPFGSIEEEITSSTFAKDNGKYIEENKLRVVLLSPPSSPALPPFNGTLKQELEASTLREQLLIGVENLPPQMADSDTTELKPTMEMEDKELKLINAEELKLHKGVEELKLPKGVGELKSAKNMEWKSAKNMEKLKPTKNMGELEATKNVEEFKLTKDVEELKLTKGVEELKIGTNGELKPSKNGKFNLTNDTVEFKSFKDVEFKVPKDVEELKLAKFVGELKLHKDIEELKSKLIELESKLTGAEITISKLRDDRSTTNEESQLLQQELVMLRRRNGVRRVQVGFPFLFVCSVAFIGLALGYLLRG